MWEWNAAFTVLETSERRLRLGLRDQGAIDEWRKVKLLRNHSKIGSLSSFDWQEMTEHFGHFEILVVTPRNSIHRGRVDVDFRADEMKLVLLGLNTVFNEMSPLI